MCHSDHFWPFRPFFVVRVKVNLVLQNNYFWAFIFVVSFYLQIISSSLFFVHLLFVLAKEPRLGDVSFLKSHYFFQSEPHVKIQNTMGKKEKKSKWAVNNGH